MRDAVIRSMFSRVSLLPEPSKQTSAFITDAMGITEWRRGGAQGEFTTSSAHTTLEKGVFLVLRACTLMQEFSLSVSSRGSLLVPQLVPWTRHSGVTKVALSVWLCALLSPAGLPAEQLY